MAYCKSCGSYIPDADEICPACGQETAEAEAREAAARKAAEEKRAAVTAKLELNDKKSRRTEYGEAREKQETREARRAGMSGEYRAPKKQDFSQDDPRREKDSRSGEYRAEYNADAADNETMGILCYLGPLLLIPLLTKPDSSFLRYHCNQGLLLAIFCILANICFSIPIIGWIGGVAGWIIGIKGFFKGLENVKNGKRSPLPIFGDITIIK